MSQVLPPQMSNSTSATASDVHINHSPSPSNLHSHSPPPSNTSNISTTTTTSNDNNKNHPKKLGVTHSIREKLNFQDERLWKRFSARRLELIDTLDLCSKKASEQEDEIKRVAQALRLEFNYNTDYEPEFDKLVRAAVQSVRRNRKRSSKSKKNGHGQGDKKVKIEGQHQHYHHHSKGGDSEDGGAEGEEEEDDDNETVSDTTYRNRFVSEISRLDSDSQGQTDMNYSRTKNFSSDDKAKATIDSMIKPRILHHHNLPHLQAHPHPHPLSHPLPNPNPNPHPQYQPSNASSPSSSSPASFQKTANTTVLPPILPINDDYLAPPPKLDANAAKGIIINHIERSKTCSESVSKKSENLQVLGKLIISTCISYIFEKSFENVNETSIQYLRNKLSGDLYLARFFRDLDPNTITSISDEVAIISLYTLLGGVVKDFGFEQIMFPLCEIIYVSILEEYPLIAKNSIPFKYSDYLHKSSESNSLNSLATIATEMQQEQQQHHHHHQQAIISAANSSRSLSPELHPYNNRNSTATTSATSPTVETKQVILRFINQALEFTYATKNSAPPRFIEIIENARQAFNLKHDVILGIKNNKTGIMIQNDFDLERLFKMSSEYRIELEIFTQRSKAIPIYEITSAIIPNTTRHTPPNLSTLTHPPPPTTITTTTQPTQPPPLHHQTTDKFILPPPLVINHHLPPALRGSPIMNSNSNNGVNNGKPPYNFLSNSSDEMINSTKTPPPAMLPRFQPLL